ncbi:MAG: hypothetical protein MZV49_11750 [Rhodopseudomonas palustris]|nr:hypothetical protein [Rhodopseudomonas palustris]
MKIELTDRRCAVILGAAGRERQIGLLKRRAATQAASLHAGAVQVVDRSCCRENGAP